MIDQLNLKLASGQAFSQLQADDYNTIVKFLIANIHAPLASQVVQKIGDYVTANPHYFNTEQRNLVLRSVLTANYRAKVSEPEKQTPEDIRRSLKSALYLSDRPDIDIVNSAVDNSYTLILKDSQTRL